MAAQDVPKTCKVITADTIAKGLLAEVKETLAKVQGPDGGVQPTLAAFLANGDPAAVKYAEWSKKTCEDKYAPTSVPRWRAHACMPLCSDTRPFPAVASTLTSAPSTRRFSRRKS